MRSSGAVHVLAVAPASPPAKNMLRIIIGTLDVDRGGGTAHDPYQGAGRGKRQVRLAARARAAVVWRLEGLRQI
jgi:hypothetical protein